jgi:hypothetical protein
MTVRKVVDYVGAYGIATGRRSNLATTVAWCRTSKGGRTTSTPRTDEAVRSLCRILNLLRVRTSGSHNLTKGRRDSSTSLSASAAMTPRSCLIKLTFKPARQNIEQRRLPVRDVACLRAHHTSRSNNRTVASKHQQRSGRKTAELRYCETLYNPPKNRSTHRFRLPCQSNGAGRFALAPVHGFIASASWSGTVRVAFVASCSPSLPILLPHLLSSAYGGPGGRRARPGVGQRPASAPRRASR